MPGVPAFVQPFRGSARRGREITQRATPVPGLLRIPGGAVPAAAAAASSAMALWSVSWPPR
jgi:hypothetical protein